MIYINRYILKYVGLCLVFWIVLFLMGCSYSGRNDQNIQWSGQVKDHYQSPRQVYFTNPDPMIDNYILSRMCIA